jgi:hypothetical protein
MGWVVSVTPRALRPWKGPPGTRWIGAGWASEPVWTEAGGKILCLCRGSNPNRPVVQSGVRHYTAWATTAPPPPPFYHSSLIFIDTIDSITTSVLQITFQLNSVNYAVMCRSSSQSVSLVAQYGLEDRGSISGRAEIFLSQSLVDRLWAPLILVSSGYRGTLSFGIKRLEREADHSPHWNWALNIQVFHLTWNMPRHSVAAAVGCELVTQRKQPSHASRWGRVAWDTQYHQVWGCVKRCLGSLVRVRGVVSGSGTSISLNFLVLVLTVYS